MYMVDCRGLAVSWADCSVSHVVLCVYGRYQFVRGVPLYLVAIAFVHCICVVCFNCLRVAEQENATGAAQEVVGARNMRPIWGQDTDAQWAPAHTEYRNPRSVVVLLQHICVTIDGIVY